MYGEEAKIIKLIKIYIIFEIKLATKDFENEIFLLESLANK